jgi:hypothetical protein
MNPEYPEQIARRLHRYSRRLNLLFPESAPFPDNPANALLAVSKEVSDALSPVRELHRLCLLKRAHPLLFTRVNILLFPQISAVHKHSHNMPFRHPP